MKRYFHLGFSCLLLFASQTWGQTVGSIQHSVSAQSLSPVILVARPDSINQFTANPSVVRQMVNGALLKLTSASDIGTAWTRLGITPQDTVGIKITAVGGQALSTHHSLVRAICDGLHAAGVPSSQIIIWDKYQDRMRTAGYALRTAGGNQPAVESIVPANNYDPHVFYKNGMIGNLIWGDYQFNNSLTSNFSDSSPVMTRSYYTTFLTQLCTKIINVPVLTDNSRVGINGCLSSLALGSVDNNRRFQGAPTYGDPAICEILDKGFIRKKVVVNILDSLVVQAAGGPTFNPLFCQSDGTLYVSRDPVAIDYLALKRLEELRKTMQVPPIGNTASHVHDAASYGLGTTDPQRIQLIRL